VCCCYSFCFGLCYYIMLFKKIYLRYLRDGLLGGSAADLENKENVAGDAVDVDECTVRFSCPNLFSHSLLLSILMFVCYLHSCICFPALVDLNKLFYFSIIIMSSYLHAHIFFPIRFATCLIISNETRGSAVNCVDKYINLHDCVDFQTKFR